MIQHSPMIDAPYLLDLGLDGQFMGLGGCNTLKEAEEVRLRLKENKKFAIIRYYDRMFCVYVRINKEV